MRARVVLLLATVGVSGVLAAMPLTRTSLAQYSPTPPPSQTAWQGPTPSGSSDEIVFTQVDVETLGWEIGSTTTVVIHGPPIVWIDTDRCTTPGRYPLQPAMVMRGEMEIATLVIVCKAVEPGYLAAPEGTPVEGGTGNGDDFMTYAAPEGTAEEEPTPEMPPEPDASPSPTEEPITEPPPDPPPEPDPDPSEPEGDPSPEPTEGE